MAPFCFAQLVRCLCLELVLSESDRSHERGFCGVGAFLSHVKRTLFFKAVFTLWIPAFICWLFLLDWMVCKVWWVILVWISFSAVVAMFWVVFLWISALATVRLRLPQPIVTSVAWCGLDWVRKNYAVGGFPFSSLEHSQYRNLIVIQIADVFGEGGLGFMMFFVGTCFAEACMGKTTRDGVRRKWTSDACWRASHCVAATLLVISVFAYGSHRTQFASLERPDDLNTCRIGLLQGSTLFCGLLEAPDVERAFEECKSLSVKHGQDCDLVVWPESVCSYNWSALEKGFIPPSWQNQSSKNIETAVAATELVLALPFVELARASKSPLLLCVPVRDYTNENKRGKSMETNSIIFVDPEKGIQPTRYNKMKLVPFAECDAASVVLGRDVFVSSRFTPGTEPTAFVIHQKEVAPDGQRTHSFGNSIPFIATVNICYDSMFSRVISQQIAILRDRGCEPDMIINSSNDADSSRRSLINMHLAAHVFRAVENRKPTLISSNSGNSAWIDCCGRLIREGKAGDSDCIVATIARTHNWGLYRYVGDTFPICCTWVTFAVMLVLMIRGLDCTTVHVNSIDVKGEEH